MYQTFAALALGESTIDHLFLLGPMLVLAVHMAVSLELQIDWYLAFTKKTSQLFLISIWLVARTLQWRAVRAARALVQVDQVQYKAVWARVMADAAAAEAAATNWVLELSKETAVLSQRSGSGAAPRQRARRIACSRAFAEASPS